MEDSRIEISCTHNDFDTDVNEIIETKLGFSLAAEDQGIGPYEYWGAKGVHSDIVTYVEADHEEFDLLFKIEKDDDEITADDILLNLDGNLHLESSYEEDDFHADYKLKVTDTPVRVSTDGIYEIWRVPMEMEES